MIQTASELLEQFIAQEQQMIDPDMKHMPTLGTAYEEITKQGIDNDFIIPKHLNLRVVSGFVSIGGSRLLPQIDCMLVHGEGTRFGLTKEYTYEIDQILCIFEVKKTLTKSQMRDAINQLAEIRKKFADNFENKLMDEGYIPDISMASYNYSALTGKAAPTTYAEINTLPPDEGVLFYTLVQESLAPISIIHGYEGYKTESGLCTAFIDCLDEAFDQNGTGIAIPSIPTLITSNKFCLVKGNGMPFVSFSDKNEWVAMFSTRHNTARLILELIWTKIAFYFRIEMPFNDGLYMENMSPLLLAKSIQQNGRVGWAYNTMEFKEKYLLRKDDQKWSPEPLSIAGVSAFNLMAAYGGQLPLNDSMAAFFSDKYSIDLDAVVQNILKTKCFILRGDNIVPLSKMTHLLTLEDETGYVAKDRQKFDLWCEENKLSPSYTNLIIL